MQACKATPRNSNKLNEPARRELPCLALPRRAHEVLDVVYRRERIRGRCVLQPELRADNVAARPRRSATLGASGSGGGAGNGGIENAERSRGDDRR